MALRIVICKLRGRDVSAVSPSLPPTDGEFERRRGVRDPIRRGQPSPEWQRTHFQTAFGVRAFVRPVLGRASYYYRYYYRYSLSSRYYYVRLIIRRCRYQNGAFAYIHVRVYSFVCACVCVLVCVRALMVSFVRGFWNKTKHLLVPRHMRGIRPLRWIEWRRKVPRCSRKRYFRFSNRCARKMTVGPMTRNGECKKFSPNIFNKSKCTNCFRQKEEHSAEALESNRVSGSTLSLY